MTPREVTLARGWGKADVHIHSAVGDGSATIREILDYVEYCTDLDLIAITDHDDIRGAQEARELAARRNYSFDVIAGSEISTLDGHLIALFIEKRVNMLQSLEKTVRAVHEQGGICIVPHPLSWLTFSVRYGKLRRVMANRWPGIYLDGIETFNPSVAGRVAHERVKRLNESLWHLPESGGSDAHHLAQIGTAHTVFEGHTAADFLLSLKESRTMSHGRFWTANDHMQGIGTQSIKGLVIHPAYKIGRVISSKWAELAGDENSTSISL